MPKPKQRLREVFVKVKKHLITSDWIKPDRKTRINGGGGENHNLIQSGHWLQLFSLYITISMSPLKKVAEIVSSLSLTRTNIIKTKQSVPLTPSSGIMIPV